MIFFRPTVHPSPLFDNKPSIPFPGSDRSVIMRTQMHLANEFGARPIQCNAYLVCNSKLILWGMLLVGYFLQILTQYGFGRKLLLTVRPKIYELALSVICFISLTWITRNEILVSSSVHVGYDR